MSASTLTYTLLIWEEIPESIKVVLMRFKDYIRPNEVPIEDENITRVFRMGFLL